MGFDELMAAGGGIMPALLGLLVVLIGLLVYGALMRLCKSVEDAWFKIDIQLRRRHNLVPNLLDTIRNYRMYDWQVLDRVAQARERAVEAESVQGKLAAENDLTESLRKLMAAIEDCSDFRTDPRMKMLQQELMSVENELHSAQRFYNDEAQRLNRSIRSVPVSFIAWICDFPKAEPFELQETAHQDKSKIKFDYFGEEAD